MVFFNYSTMQMAAKVVYYGPGLCGKTTNLHYIYGHTTTDSRGEMVSLETETDRTLFFDLLPLDVGSIAGFNTRIQLYTVPGQVFYNTTRKLVLKGVDGVVFVVDSQRAMLQANLDSFRNLEENLAEMGLAVDSLPLVLQYNKRDLADIYTVDELNHSINRQGWPHFEASAVAGQGVFETLKGISKHTLLALKRRLGRSGAESGAGSRLSSGVATGQQRGATQAPLAGQPPAPPAAPAAPGNPPASAPSVPSSMPAAGQPALRSSPHVPGAAALAQRTALADASETVPLPPAAAMPARSPAPADGPASRPAEAAAPPATPAAPGAPPALAAAAAQVVAGGIAARSAPPPAGPPAAQGAPARTRTPTGKSRSVDVLSELEKLRREAMQSTGTHSTAGYGTSQSPRGAAAGTAPAPAPSSAARAAAGNGRAELSRNIEMTLKRADFVRARRFLVSFQVEDDQHRVVDAVRDLQVEIKDTGDATVEKLLLRLNIALHAKE